MAGMNDHDRLMQAVREAPDDDAPRLVLADWFEENGDAERGELIRVQCRMAKMPYHPSEWYRLRDREKELLDANRERWLTPFPRVSDRGVKDEGRWQFTRGFVDFVTLSARSFLAHGEAVFRLAPVRRLRVVGVPRHLPSVLRSPLLARVEDLLLTDQRFTWANVLQLTRSPALAQVRGLFLGSSGIGDEAAEALFSSSYLTNLRQLNLAWSPIGDDGLEAIADADMPSLKWLGLINAPVGVRGLRELVSSRSLPNLSELGVGSRTVGPREAEAIASAPVPRLKELEFELGEIRSAGAAALARSPGMANLESLRLEDNQVGPEGVEAIAASPHLRKLRELNIGSNRVGDRGAIALASSPVLDTLESLDLGWARIKKDGVKALANSRRLKNLKHLDLGENNFGREGAKALAESPHLSRLECLNLRHTKLSKRDKEMLRERFGDVLMM
jgi:uncharacterized protein (TIGR02996 family)